MSSKVDGGMGREMSLLLPEFKCRSNFKTEVSDQE